MEGRGRIKEAASSTDPTGLGWADHCASPDLTSTSDYNVTLVKNVAVQPLPGGLADEHGRIGQNAVIDHVGRIHQGIPSST